MKLGFKNEDFDQKAMQFLDECINQVKDSCPRSQEFRFASNIIRNILDFASYSEYNQTCSQAIEVLEKN